MSSRCFAALKLCGAVLAAPAWPGLVAMFAWHGDACLLHSSPLERLSPLWQSGYS
ncbi:MAG: hypothetical protein OXC07_03770 [Kistimonas sp.]|nr:hypothetical protein [Kistimonas sp.]